MQPWQHAKLTSKRHGIDWQHDLPIHEFIDSAKSACPDMRHRVVLHNTDLGPTLAQMAFPERDDCAEIVREHVKQDLGNLPTLEDWTRKADGPLAMGWRRPNDEKIIEDACKNLGLCDEGPVWDVYFLLTKATQFLPENEAFARLILMNSFGPFLARQILGPAYAIENQNGRTVIFDPAWVAEGIIVANCGRIFSLSHVLAPFEGSLAR